MENEARFCTVSHHGSNQEMFYLDPDFSRLAAVFSPFSARAEAIRQLINKSTDRK